MNPNTGILLINLGTPDAPTEKAVKAYLAEFLSDPHVIDYPAWLWRPILNNFILTSRPEKSAEAYAKIWTESGSPLLEITRSITSKLDQKMDLLPVSMGMRYGNPSIERGLMELREKEVTRLVIFPLFPQYSTTTNLTTIHHTREQIKGDTPFQKIIKIEGYHDHPAYISALANSIQRARSEMGKPDMTLFSYHGIPKRYVAFKGEPYQDHCYTTSQLTADKVGIRADEMAVSFQSQFGPEPWLKPYTEETLRKLGKEGCQSLHVLCPGFPADCLETLEEIDIAGRKTYTEAGGGEFHYIPALNDRDQHIQALASIAQDALHQ